MRNESTVIMQLGRDVTNPFFDRRRRGWEYAPVWAAGMRFAVNEVDIGLECDIESLCGIIVKRVRPVGEHGSWLLLNLRTGKDRPETQRAQAIIDALVLAPVTPQTVLESGGICSRTAIRIMTHLVDVGKLTLEDVYQVAQWHNRDETA